MAYHTASLSRPSRIRVDLILVTKLGNVSVFWLLYHPPNFVNIQYFKCFYRTLSIDVVELSPVPKKRLILGTFEPLIGGSSKLSNFFEKLFSWDLNNSQNIFLPIVVLVLYELVWAIEKLSLSDFQSFNALFAVLIFIWIQNCKLHWHLPYSNGFFLETP